MSDKKIFVASEEAKGKAKQLRMFAILSWVVAIGLQIFAILKLIKNETLIWLIVVMAVMLGLSILGSYLWKKANRLDPASEKEKFKFFVQNQLGAIMGVIAFLPLVIFIFTNKNIDGKTKGIAGSIAAVFLVIAGIIGVDFNPPSVEKYTEEINKQTDRLSELDVPNNVYWSHAGNKYHIDEDCFHIKNTTEKFNGTVKESFEQKGISELCKSCEKRAEKKRTISSDEVTDLLEEVTE